MPDDYEAEEEIESEESPEELDSEEAPEVDEPEQQFEEHIEPEPEPWRGAMEEAFGAFAEQMQSQMQQMFAPYQQRMQQPQTQRPMQPNRPEPHPWQKDPLSMVEAGASPETVRYYQALQRDYDNRFQSVNQQYSQRMQELEMKFEAERLGRHFENISARVINDHGLPAELKPVVDNVIMGMYSAMPQGGDPYRLDPNKVIKQLVDWGSAQKKAQKQALKQAGVKQKAKPAGPSSKASPTKPGKKKRQGNSMEDLDAEFDALSEEYFGEGA